MALAFDASGLDAIGAEHADAFAEHGLLVLRGVLAGAELDALRAETLELVERAVGDPAAVGDVRVKRHELTGEEVPWRIEYVVDKSAACRALAGHPFVLRSVERLQGAAFLPTWDSMVFKLAGAGAAVPWHRDEQPGYELERPIFNVDFYLDGSDETNCLWGVPGSHRWPAERARETLERLSEGGFRTDGAVPLPMEPGDVLFHDIRVLHGSAPAQSGLRRVLYYEFRPVATELRHGQHVPEYVEYKLRVLSACLRERAATPYAAGERVYVPAAPLPAEPPETFRYAHEDWFRPAA